MNKYILSALVLIGSIGSLFAGNQVIVSTDTNQFGVTLASSIVITNSAVITSTNCISYQAVIGVTNSTGSADAGKVVKLDDNGQINTNMLSAAFSSPFTASFTSTNLAITAGGALTVPHGLGAMPSLVQVRVKCTSGDNGYSVGDEVIMPFNATDKAANIGISVVPDSTNLNLRYGSDATSFAIMNKSNGNVGNLTDASWVLIIRAWK